MLNWTHNPNTKQALTLHTDTDRQTHKTDHATPSVAIACILCTRWKNFDIRPCRCLITPHNSKWIRLTLTPIAYMLPWVHMSAPKRHLDQFIQFCRSNKRDKQTDRPATLLCV